MKENEREIVYYAPIPVTYTGKIPDCMNICPVCGKFWLDEYSGCDECLWENDPWAIDNPDEKGGANKMTLNEAREAYKKGERVL